MFLFRVVMLVVVGLMGLGVFDGYGVQGDVGKEPRIVGYEYSRGDFTIYVESGVPWVVWWTPDLGLPWVKVSRVQGSGIRSWTDYGVGLSNPLGFYMVLPRGKEPLPGNRNGWYYNERNPHWPVATP